MIWCKRKKDGLVGYVVEGNDCKFPDSAVCYYPHNHVTIAPDLQPNDVVKYRGEQAVITWVDPYRPDVKLVIGNVHYDADRFECVKLKRECIPGDMVEYRGQIGKLVWIADHVDGKTNRWGIVIGEGIYLVDSAEVTFAQRHPFAVGDHVTHDGRAKVIQAIDGNRIKIDDHIWVPASSLRLQPEPPVPLKEGDRVRIKVDGRPATVTALRNEAGRTDHVVVTVAIGDGTYNTISLHINEVER